MRCIQFGILFGILQLLRAKLTYKVKKLPLWTVLFQNFTDHQSYVGRNLFWSLKDLVIKKQGQKLRTKSKNLNYFGFLLEVWEGILHTVF